MIDWSYVITVLNESGISHSEIANKANMAIHTVKHLKSDLSSQREPKYSQGCNLIAMFKKVATNEGLKTAGFN